MSIKTKLSQTSKISWLYFLPLLLIAGFVPLIVYGKYINLTGTAQAIFWTGQNELLDFFSYWKSRWVIFLTITSTVVYIFLLAIDKLPLKKEYKYYIPFIIYSFFVILSTIFAVDKPTAFNGFVDMYQGMWVLLSYIMITFLVLNFVNTDRDVMLIVKAFIVLIIIEGVIGVGQYFGFDIFNTSFGNNLIIPSGVRVDGGLNFTFGKHTIYGTLFNTNFVGSFAALMLPIAVAFLLCVKTLKRRIIAGLALLLCLFTWIGCNSRAGYVGVAFSAFIALLLLRKYIMKYWRYSVIVFALIIIGLIGFNFLSGGTLLRRIGSLNLFKEIDNIKTQNLGDDIFKFNNIELGKDYVKIETTKQDLHIKIDGEKLYFIDENGEVLPMISDFHDYLMVDKPDHDYLRLKTSDTYPGFSIVTPIASQGNLVFYIAEDGVKLLGGGGKVLKPINAKHIRIFDGLETFASGRGYIWSRSIPLLGKYILWGAGADNYTIVFPQGDYIAKLNTGMQGSAVIDKPHNMYLQIAINTGLISLIALLIVWGIYIINSIKLYWNVNFNSIDKYIGIACFISILGYLFAGIFNDHIVSVSPIFWCILGLGISINARIKSEEE